MNPITACPLVYGYDSNKSKVLPVTSFNEVFGRQSLTGPVLPWPGAQGVPVRFHLRDNEQLCLQIDVPPGDEYDVMVTNGAVATQKPVHMNARLDGSDKSVVAENVQPGAICASFRTPGGIKRAAPVIEHGSHGFLTIETADHKASDVWLVVNFVKR